jgi:hypothetical protein
MARGERLDRLICRSEWIGSAAESRCTPIDAGISADCPFLTNDD